MTNRRIPQKGKNNLWYYYNESDTVIVFVHGIFSDSKSCWMYEDKNNHANNKYWPEMIIEDNRINEVSIYLAGFYTAIESGPYEIRNCADEILAAIQRVDENFNPIVLSKKNIIFICHSTGGIVIRYLLENNHELFVDKNIGLVLIASPSYGSKLEDKLDWLSRFYNQKLGQQLKWGNWSLSDLDDRFKRLLYEKRIPNLFGVEGFENHFIIKHKWFPCFKKTFVVTKESAGRYFGPPILLKNTDHFSAAKPNDIHHPTHEQLFIGFLSKYFSTVLKTPISAKPDLEETIQPNTEKASYVSRDDIEFVNRINELQFITNSIYGPPYTLIDSPKGFGKTRLMKAIKDELERLNWLCINIDLQKNNFSSIGEIAVYFFRFLNKDDSLHCDLTHPENAADEVGRCILQRLKALNKKDVLIQIDALEKIDKDLINDLLTIFIPTIAMTIHHTVNLKLKVMLAGRYITEWENYSEIPFKIIQLSPFDFEIVYQSVQHFDSSSVNMKNDYQKNFSAWLMFFTGGHPKSMSEILLKNYGSSINLINTKKKELYETIIKPTIIDIKNHIPSKLRDIMEHICVARRFNGRLLNKFIKSELIKWNEGSEYELENLLCQTYLVTRKDGFLQDNITRRLLAIDLYKNNPKLFITIYRETLSFYEERLKNHEAHGKHIIAIEILFQELQYISGKNKKNKNFFFKKLEDVLGQLKLMNDSISILESFTEALNKDWEFRFMLNYLFCEVNYDERPFNELRRMVRIAINKLKSLENGGKNGG